VRYRRIRGEEGRGGTEDGRIRRNKDEEERGGGVREQGDERIRECE